MGGGATAFRDDVQRGGDGAGHVIARGDTGDVDRAKSGSILVVEVVLARTNPVSTGCVVLSVDD